MTVHARGRALSMQFAEHGREGHRKDLFAEFIADVQDTGRAAENLDKSLKEKYVRRRQCRRGAGIARAARLRSRYRSRNSKATSANIAIGRPVTVRVKDRGPYVAERAVDVSYSAADARILDQHLRDASEEGRRCSAV